MNRRSAPRSFPARRTPVNSLISSRCSASRRTVRGTLVAIHLVAIRTGVGEVVGRVRDLLLDSSCARPEARRGRPFACRREPLKVRLPRSAPAYRSDTSVRASGSDRRRRSTRSRRSRRPPSRYTRRRTYRWPTRRRLGFLLRRAGIVLLHVEDQIRIREIDAAHHLRQCAGRFATPAPRLCGGRLGDDHGGGDTAATTAPRILITAF